MKIRGFHPFLFWDWCFTLYKERKALSPFPVFSPTNGRASNSKSIDMKRCEAQGPFFGELQDARRWLLLLVMILMVAGCSNEDEPEVDTGEEQEVARIVVTPEEVTLGINEVQQFTAEVFDSDGELIPGAEVEWFSSLPNIAHVNENGLAETQEPGSTTINAYLDDIVGNALLTVEGDEGGN